MEADKQDKYYKWKGRAYKTWTLVGFCILAGVVLYICNILWQAVATIVVTALAVFLLHGLVNRMEHHGIPRALGTTICFVVVSAIIVGCVLAFIPALVTQISNFIGALPSHISELHTWIASNFDEDTTIGGFTISGLLDDASDWIRNQGTKLASTLADGLVGSIVGIGNVVVIGFISFVCAFWILLDLPTISREVRSLFADKYQDDIDIFADAFRNAVYGWAKSTLVCAVITGVCSGVVFWIMGIPYSGMLGFLCGIAYFVPYIGPMVSAAIVAVVALFVSPLVCIGSIVVNVIITNVVGNIISPKLMKSSVNVHPALVLIAILIGGALGGVAGMLLSIPIIATLQGVFVTYYEARTGKNIATEDGALFQKQTVATLPTLDTGRWHIPKDPK